MAIKVPLYYSIMEVIKESIINGIYPIGSMLPTETDFENEFKVSKITIRKAIELLENDGYVTKKSGKGTTVISNSIFNKLSKGDSFSTILNKEGVKLSKEHTTFEKISLVPQNELFKYFSHECIKVSRLYYLDGHPYIHMTHYLPGDIGIEEVKNQNNFSIYMHLYKYNYQVQKFEDEFYVDYPSLEILSSLKMEDGPVLGRKRLTYGFNDKVIEVSYAKYNTKKHHYQINYQV